MVGCFSFFFKSLALVNDDFNIPDEIQGERLVYFRSSVVQVGKRGVVSGVRGVGELEWGLRVQVRGEWVGG